MTKDARSYSRFEDVYNFGFAAVAKLDERRKEATDPDDIRDIAIKRKELMDLLNKVRRAELVELRRPGGADPVSVLNSALKQARKELKGLEKLATALASVQRIIDLATRVVSIVK